MGCVHSLSQQTDAIAQFQLDIIKTCLSKQLPPFEKQQKYSIYVCKQSTSTHGNKGIVIGCDVDDDSKEVENTYGFLTIELFTNPYNERVYPFAELISLAEGNQRIASNKWQKIIRNLQTTMQHFCLLTISLIDNYSSYDTSVTNCRQFVNRFQKYCENPDQALLLMAKAQAMNKISNSVANLAKLSDVDAGQVGYNIARGTVKCLGSMSAATVKTAVRWSIMANVHTLGETDTINSVEDAILNNLNSNDVGQLIRKLQQRLQFQNTSNSTGSITANRGNSNYNDRSQHTENNRQSPMHLVLTNNEESKDERDGDNINREGSIMAKLTKHATVLSVFSDATAVSGVSGLSAGSGATGVTGISGVSTVAPELSVVDPLVVILGIGEYDDLPNLEGVTDDYQDVIDAFVDKWKYKVFYQLKNDICVYSNNKQEVELKNDYKLKWNCDEIDVFVEKARQQLVNNKHDGLLFAISSHGDTGKIIVDSNGEEYELESLFSMFSEQARMLLESYKETKQQSNRFFTIPKIFLIDSCRGTPQAKATDISLDEKNNDNDTDDDNEREQPNDRNTATRPPVPQPDRAINNNNRVRVPTKKEQAHNVNYNPNSNDNSSKKGDSDEKDSNPYRFKAVSKEKAQKIHAQMSNYCKLYANVEGYAVLDRVFLQNVCKVFRDRQWVQNHVWSDIVQKIREYTKRKGTISGSLYNFTQIVENEGTLEQGIRFGSKDVNISMIIPSLEHVGKVGTIMEFDDDYETQYRVTITNLSPTNKIAVLVETEPTQENREVMIQSLRRATTEKEFAEYKIGTNGSKFVIIGPNGERASFDKHLTSVYITLFEINSSGYSSSDLYKREQFVDDYLYFSEKRLYVRKHFIPRCQMVAQQEHGLKHIQDLDSDDEDIDHNDVDEKKSDQQEPEYIRYSSHSYNKCVLCDVKIEISDVRYKCTTCGYLLCEKCCDLIICKKTSLSLNIPLIINTMEQTDAKHVRITFKHSTTFKSYLNQTITNSTGHDLKYEVIPIVYDGNGNKKELTTNVYNFVVDNDTVEAVLPLPDNLETEFKQESVDFTCQVRIIDLKHNLRSIKSEPAQMPVQISNFYKYDCVFTTLGGKGRIGPNSINNYKGLFHFKDTELDRGHHGIQLWTVPKTGKWHVVCFGAKGGDSVDTTNIITLSGGKGAKVGGILELRKGDVIKILCGQKGIDNRNKLGGGGGGGTFFVLHKREDKVMNTIANDKSNNTNNSSNNDNYNYKGMIIAAGGNGACEIESYSINGINGLCNYNENGRDNINFDYQNIGRGGRGGSFKNDLDKFESLRDGVTDYTECSGKSFVQGGNGGTMHSEYDDGDSCVGGFGGGGAGCEEGGGGGGYIGGIVCPVDPQNHDSRKYQHYGASSYNTCQNDQMKITISGYNRNDGKVQVRYANNTYVKTKK